MVGVTVGFMGLKIYDFLREDCLVLEPGETKAAKRGKELKEECRP